MGKHPKQKESVRNCLKVYSTWVAGIQSSRYLLVLGWRAGKWMRNGWQVEVKGLAKNIGL